MLTKRVLLALALLLSLVPIEVWRSVRSLPTPRRVEVTWLGGGSKVESVAEFEGETWLATYTGYFRLRDGFRPPQLLEAARLFRPLSLKTGWFPTRLVVWKGALWAHLGPVGAWIRDDGRARTIVPFDPDGDLPILPAVLGLKDDAAVARLDADSPSYIHGNDAGVILGQTTAGVWFRANSVDGAVEVLSPDGSITAYVDPGFVDQRVRLAKDAGFALFVGIAFVGTTIVLLARAADLATRRRRLWAVFASAAFILATFGTPAVLRFLDLL